MICLQREERRAITLPDLEHIDVDVAHVVIRNLGIVCDTQQMICRICMSKYSERDQTDIRFVKCPPKTEKRMKSCISAIC